MILGRGPEVLGTRGYLGPADAEDPAVPGTWGYLEPGGAWDPGMLGTRQHPGLGDTC
jgi:hypothetical protein